MTEDLDGVDEIIRQWARSRPELDVSARSSKSGFAYLVEHGRDDFGEGGRRDGGREQIRGARPIWVRSSLAAARVSAEGVAGWWVTCTGPSGSCPTGSASSVTSMFRRVPGAQPNVVKRWRSRIRPASPTVQTP